MKKWALLFVFGFIGISITFTCKQKPSNHRSEGVQLSTESIFIHDSTYIFYEDFCREYIANFGPEKEDQISNRGAIFTLAVRENELIIESDKTTEPILFLEGAGKLEGNKFNLWYSLRTRDYLREI